MPTASPSREPSFGEWLHRELVAAYGLETEAWAIEQVRRVIWKLNRVRSRKPRFQVAVLCLELFDILKAHALDYGDVEAVYGVDDELDLAENPLDRLFLKTRGWRLRRKGSHPPLVERHARLRGRLAEARSQSPVPR